MKFRKVIYWIVGFFLFFGWADLVWGQRIDIIPERPELVPYMIVPIDPHPGDCNLEVGIRLVHPYNVENMQEPQQQETLEIIYQRIGYEIVNPQMSAGMFEIDGKLYHLIRIPYTSASTEWDWDY